MRIRSISAYSYNANYRYGEYSMSHGRVTVGHPALVIRVRTDTGLEDVVVTQDLCAVCAVDVSVVDDALAFLGCRAEVVTIDPHTLAEVDESILRLGEVTGQRASSRALVSSIQQRMTQVADRVKGRPRPRVAVLEWTDPPFAG